MGDGKWCAAREATQATGNNLFRYRVGVLSRVPTPSTRPIDTNPKQRLRTTDRPREKRHLSLFPRKTRVRLGAEVIRKGAFRRDGAYGSLLA